MLSIEMLSDNKIWPLIERAYDFVLCFEIETGKIIRKYGFDKVCIELDSYDNYYPLMARYKSDYVNEASYEIFVKNTSLDYISKHDYVKFVGLEDIENRQQHWYEYLIVVDCNIGVMLINDIHGPHCRMLELEEASSTDYLTGLMNRRMFDDHLYNAVEKKIDFSLISIDVDNFKIINDTYGHDTGDCVLSGISDCLRKTLPEGAIIARYGGDEFAAILQPALEKKSLMILLKGLNHKIRNESICGMKVSVSMGSSNYSNNGVALSKVLKNADEALYDAKSQGKNQSVIK